MQMQHVEYTSTAHHPEAPSQLSIYCMSSGWSTWRFGVCNFLDEDRGRASASPAGSYVRSSSLHDYKDSSARLARWRISVRGLKASARQRRPRGKGVRAAKASAGGEAFWRLPRCGSQPRWSCEYPKPSRPPSSICSAPLASIAWKRRVWLMTQLAAVLVWKRCGRVERNTPPWGSNTKGVPDGSSPLGWHCSLPSLPS